MALGGLLRSMFKNRKYGGNRVSEEVPEVPTDYGTGVSEELPGAGANWREADRYQFGGREGLEAGPFIPTRWPGIDGIHRDFQPQPGQESIMMRNAPGPLQKILGRFQQGLPDMNRLGESLGDTYDMYRDRFSNQFSQNLPDMNRLKESFSDTADMYKNENLKKVASNYLPDSGRLQESLGDTWNMYKNKFNQWNQG